jgi:hypothetical protein
MNGIIQSPALNDKTMILALVSYRRAVVAVGTCTDDVDREVTVPAVGTRTLCGT